MGYIKNYPVNTDKLREVIDILQKGRKVTTLWLPKMSRTEFGSKLQNKDLSLEILGSKYKNFLNSTIFLFLSLNLSEKFFLLQLEEELLNYSSKKGIRPKLKEITGKGKSVVLVIDNFNFKNLELLQYIITLSQIDMDNISYVFIALESDFNQEKLNLEEFGMFYENIVLFNYLSFAEFEEWYKHNKDKYKKDLPPKVLKEIYSFSGGMSGIIKVIMENFGENEDFGKVIETKEIKDYLQSVWDRFTLRERKIIKGFIKGSKVPPYPKEVAYLKAHGLIDAQNNVRPDWFKYLIDQPVRIELRLEGGAIYWDDINISQLLKDRDNRILLALFNAKGETLTRDNLAEIIWGKDWTIDFSNWALDQSLSRLRKKLKEVGLPDIIKSSKGRGFYLAS